MKCLKDLKEEVKLRTPHAEITAPIKEKAEIKNIQSDGISIFDNQPMKDRFHQKNFDEIKKDLISLYETIKLD